MSFPVLLAQLRYNTERLSHLPAPAQSKADRKVLRDLLSSTLDTLLQLSIAQLALRRVPRGLNTFERGLHHLRALERELLAVSPGQEVSPVLWATLQQALSTVLAEVVTAYQYT